MQTFEITLQSKTDSHFPAVVEYVQRGYLTIRREGIFNFNADRRDELQRLELKPKDYGTLLGGLLFKDDIRDIFMQARQRSEGDLRVLVVVEAQELKSLRWERLCAPVRTGSQWDFLSLDQQSLYSLYLPSITDRRFPAIGRLDLKALVLIANPPENNSYGLPPFDALAAVSGIRSSLGEIPHDMLANVDGAIGQPTLDDLCASITGRHYTILHIVAHGWFNAKIGETIIYLLNSKGDVSPAPASKLIERLDKLQGVRGLPHLIFLCTCESAIAGAETTSALGGLAQRLVRDLGIPAVIAMTEKVSMKTADALAANFYIRLREHGEVDRAMVQACASLAEAADATVPALYSRLGGRPLFSDTEDRPLTPNEIESGLKCLESLLPERAPILLDSFLARAEFIRPTLGAIESSFSDTARQERNLALDDINAICEKVLDINFRALALGQNVADYDGRCPFPGMLPFQPGDYEFFFGREPLVKILTKRLFKEYVLAILGGSGSGKSSLAMAGIVPALREKHPDIRITCITPGSGNLDRLAKSNDQGECTSSLMISQPFPQVLILDQFEELFTLCTDIPRRKVFITYLVEAINKQKEEKQFLSSELYVIITMRADFWGECAVYPELKTIMQEHQELVGPMTTSELRSAMEQQAAKVGFRFEADLSHNILSEVENEPGAMPLLQHLLQELWKRRHGRWICTSEYHVMGGIRQAISYTADELYDSLSDTEKNYVRNIFIRLTRLSDSGSDNEIRDTRRHVLLEDLVPAGDNPEFVRNIIKRLADARLVVTRTKAASVSMTLGKRDDAAWGEATIRLKRSENLECFDKGEAKTEVEVAHEALIRYWPRMRKWLDEDRNSLRLLSDISESATKWDNSNRQQNLLPRWNARLEEALFLFHQSRFVQSKLEQDYLDACVHLRDMEKAEKEAQEKRERKALEQLAAEQTRRAEDGALAAKKIKRRFVIAVIVGIIAVIAMIFSTYQRGIAQRNEQKAHEAKLKAQKAEQIAIQAGQIAVQQKQIAETNEREARINLVRMYEEKAGFVLNSALQYENPDQNFQMAWLFTLVALNQEIVKLPLSLGRLEFPELRRGIYRQLWASPVSSYGEIAGFSRDGRYLATGYLDMIKLWDSKTGKLLKTFYGHSGKVNSVAFSPDSQRIASGAKDNTVRFWDVETGKETQQIYLHTHAVRCVSFSPDGTYLASASDDNTVNLLSAETGCLLKKFAEHSRPVYAIDFSPDGKVLASASADHTVRLWNIETEANIKTFSGYSGELHSVDFSPDGKWLAAGSSDYTIRIWDTESGKESAILSGHSDKVVSVCFSPDGKRLVSGALDQTVRFWNAETGDHIRTCSEYLSRLNQVLYSPDGKTLLSCSEDGMVVLREGETGMEMTAFSGHLGKVFSVEFSPDGELLASGSEDKRIHLWDVQTGKKVMAFTQHSKAVICLAFSSDGKHMASGSEDTTINIWDAENMMLVSTISGHTKSVLSLCFSPNGKQLASGSADETIRIWDTQTGKELHQFSGNFISGYGVVFSPDGNQLTFGSNDNIIRIRDLTISEKQHGKAEEFRTFTGHDEKVVTLAFNSDGTMLASGSTDNSIRLWDVRTGKLLKTLTGHLGWINDICFNSDGMIIASGSTDKTVRLWDVRSGKEIKAFSGHTGYINSVSLSPDGKRVASGSEDRTVRFWETGITDPSGDKKQISGSAFTGHSDWVSSVNFSPDGKKLVSGAIDNSIWTWDIQSGKQLNSMSGNPGMVMSVAFSPEGKYIASASLDKTVKLYDAETGKELKVFSGHSAGVNWAIFRPDGKQLASASEDYSIRIWDIESGREKAVLSGHTLDVQKISYSPNGLWLASASWDKTIRVWDANTGKEIKVITGHESDVLSVDFSPDGKFLASSSTDKTVRLWSVESGQEMLTLFGHTGEIWHVRFSPDGRQLASASKDKTIRLWDAYTGENLAIFSGHSETIFSLAFSPDGSVIASASRDKTIRLWQRELINPYMLSGRKADTFVKLYQGSFELLGYRMSGVTLVQDSQPPYLPMMGTPISFLQQPRPLGKDPVEWILEYENYDGKTEHVNEIQDGL